MGERVLMHVAMKPDAHGVAYGVPEVTIVEGGRRVLVPHVQSVTFYANADGFPEVDVVVSAAMADVELEGYGRIVAETEVHGGDPK